ncbi:MAG: hypothetical protein ABI758_04030 [Candidatus Woesebacteria bacterium]
MSRETRLPYESLASKKFEELRVSGELDRIIQRYEELLSTGKAGTIKGFSDKNRISCYLFTEYLKIYRPDLVRTKGAPYKKKSLESSEAKSLARQHVFYESRTVENLQNNGELDAIVEAYQAHISSPNGGSIKIFCELRDISIKSFNTYIKTQRPDLVRKKGLKPAKTAMSALQYEHPSNNQDDDGEADTHILTRFNERQ